MKTITRKQLLDAVYEHDDGQLVEVQTVESDGSDGWRFMEIKDLAVGDSVRLRIYDEWAELVPEITETRCWDVDDVRSCCIKNELYTWGSNEDFERMLTMVFHSFPDNESLYIVAKDIAEHSDDQTVSNVMYLLAKDAVRTTFSFKD